MKTIPGPVFEMTMPEVQALVGNLYGFSPTEASLWTLREANLNHRRIGDLIRVTACKAPATPYKLSLDDSVTTWDYEAVFCDAVNRGELSEGTYLISCDW